MTVGQDLMEKYPIGVSERIAKEIDDAIRQAVEEDRKLGFRFHLALVLTAMVGGYLIGSYIG